MYQAFIAAVAALSLFLHIHPAYPKMVDKVSASVVHVTGEMDVDTFIGPMHVSYSCSGEVVAHNKILTAAHCVAQGSNIHADGYAVKVLAVDTHYDLALLEADTHNKPVLQIRDTPVVRFEHLTAIGYAWGMPRLTVLDVRAFLLNAVPPGAEPGQGVPGILVQGAYIGGMSGGPVVDSYGQMVSMVQQGGDGTGFGIGVEVLHVFLLGLL